MLCASPQLQRCVGDRQHERRHSIKNKCTYRDPEGNPHVDWEPKVPIKSAHELRQVGEQYDCANDWRRNDGAKCETSNNVYRRVIHNMRCRGCGVNRHGRTGCHLFRLCGHSWYVLPALHCTLPPWARADMLYRQLCASSGHGVSRDGYRSSGCEHSFIEQSIVARLSLTKRGHHETELTG